MGVAILQAYPVPADKTASAVIDLLQKRIVNLGASHTGQFLVDCETYFSSPAISNPPKSLHVIHNSEQPATVFSILETPAKAVTFTSDTLFDLLLLKLSNVYSKKNKIESKGPRFEIGDFLVKLGVVSTNGNFRGILVEVEYLPCVVVQSCWGLLCEFMQGFLGSVVTSQVPAFLEKKATNEVYTPVDTVQQYLEHFNNFKKSPGQQQQHIVRQSPQQGMQSHM